MPAGPSHVPAGPDHADVPEKSKGPEARRLQCPSCQQTIKSTHPDQFRAHVTKCCPDAFPQVPRTAWTEPADAAKYIAVYEVALTAAAKELAYGDRRLSHVEVAVQLGVTPLRVKEVLRRASRAIPLVADTAPLDVLYEDADLLVVNKPPGLRFHPVHRFEGNSLLSRCIGHMHRNQGQVLGQSQGEDWGLGQGSGQRVGDGGGGGGEGKGWGGYEGEDGSASAGGCSDNGDGEGDRRSSGVDPPPGAHGSAEDKGGGGGGGRGGSSLVSGRQGSASQPISKDGGRGGGGGGGEVEGGPGAFPHIVHRLDMDTSGVCMFVKKKSLVDGFARLGSRSTGQ